MKYISEIEHKDELATAVVQELKNIGIKVTKYKKNQLKQETKDVSTLFGTSIENLPFVTTDDYQTRIPKFLHDSASIIEKNLHTEGLFRLAGSVARQKELRKNLETGKTLSEENSHVYDVANVMKQFFRELPERLITNRLEDYFVKAHQLEDSQDRVMGLLLLVLLLPLEHLYVLRYIMQLLSNVATHHEWNKMDMCNLAVVMAPNLMPQVQKPEKGKKVVQIQTSIIHTLIQYAERIGMVPMTVLEKMPSYASENEVENHEHNREFKKRRNSLNGVLNNFRKKVAPRTPVSSDESIHLSLFHINCLDPPSDNNGMQTPSKRKAETDLSLTPAKKRANVRADQILLDSSMLMISPLSPSHWKTPMSTGNPGPMHFFESPSINFVKKETYDSATPFKGEAYKYPKEKTKCKRFFSPLKLSKRSRKHGTTSPRVLHRKQQATNGASVKASEDAAKSSVDSSAMVNNFASTSSSSDTNENCTAVKTATDANIPMLIIEDASSMNSTNEKVIEDNFDARVTAPTEFDVSKDFIESKPVDSTENNISMDLDVSRSTKDDQDSKEKLRSSSEEVITSTPVLNVCEKMNAANLNSPNETVEVTSGGKQVDNNEKLSSNKKVHTRVMSSKSFRIHRPSPFESSVKDEFTPPSLKRAQSIQTCLQYINSLNKSSIRRGRPNTVSSGLPSPSPFKSLQTLTSDSLNLEFARMMAGVSRESLHGCSRDDTYVREFLVDESIKSESGKVNGIVSNVKGDEMSCTPVMVMKTPAIKLISENYTSFTSNDSMDSYSGSNNLKSSKPVSTSSLNSLLSEVSSTVAPDGDCEMDDLHKLVLSDYDNGVRAANECDNTEVSDEKARVLKTDSKGCEDDMAFNDTENKTYCVSPKTNACSGAQVDKDHSKSTIKDDNAWDKMKGKSAAISKRKNAKENISRKPMDRHPKAITPNFGTVQIAPLTPETCTILSNVQVTLENSTEKQVWQSAENVVSTELLAQNGRPSLIQLKKERAGMVSASIRKINSMSEGKVTPVTKSKYSRKPPSTIERGQNLYRIKEENVLRPQNSNPKMPLTDYVRRNSSVCKKSENNLTRAVSQRSTPTSFSNLTKSSHSTASNPTKSSHSTASNPAKSSHSTASNPAKSSQLSAGSVTKTLLSSSKNLTKNSVSSASNLTKKSVSSASNLTKSSVRSSASNLTKSSSRSSATNLTKSTSMTSRKPEQVVNDARKRIISA